jgi:hypothetical protein
VCVWAASSDADVLLLQIGAEHKLDPSRQQREVARELRYPKLFAINLLGEPPFDASGNPRVPTATTPERLV